MDSHSGLHSSSSVSQNPSSSSKGSRRKLDDVEVDIDELARSELNKLQREYQRMDHEEAGLAQTGRGLGRCQARVVSILEDEKESLIVDLINAENPKNIEKDQMVKEKIGELLEAYENCEINIGNKLRVIEEMGLNMKKIKEKLIQEKLMALNVPGTSSLSQVQIDRKTDTLENRLYHVTTQLNSKNHLNANLRGSINDLLNQRSTFYSKHMDLKKKTKKAKARIGQLVYEASNTYDQSEELVSKMRAIREKDERESKQHLLEMKEYNRILIHDEQLNEFMRTKNQERDILEDEKDRFTRITKDRSQAVDSLLKLYQKSFNSLMDISQTNDIDTIIKKCKDQEHHNFELFQRTTEMNSEVEALEDANRTLRKEIEKAKLEQKAARKGERREIKELENGFISSHNKLMNTVESFDKSKKEMEKVVEALETLFNMAGCDKAPIMQLLGNKDGVNPRNALLSMKVIENRASELVHELQVLEARKKIEIDKKRPKTLAPIRQGHIKGQGGPYSPNEDVMRRLLDFELRQDEDDSSSAEMSRAPLGYHDLKKIVQASMAVVLGREEEPEEEDTPPEDEDPDN